jgi:hypothetical protein
MTPEGRDDATSHFTLRHDDDRLARRPPHVKTRNAPFWDYRCNPPAATMSPVTSQGSQEDFTLALEDHLVTTPDGAESRGQAQHLLMDRAVDTSLEMTSQITGLPKESSCCGDPRTPG